MEKIVLLGATGSIGKSVLGVLRNYPGRFQLISVSGFRNLRKLEEIVREFSPSTVCLSEDSAEFRRKFPGAHFVFGNAGLSELGSLPEADTVVIAVSGNSGFYPTVSAIRSGKKILSANKESIISAGGYINGLLKKEKSFIIPLDSEHNAVFNILRRFPETAVRQIALTASGGPFLKKKITGSIRVEDVLKHPTWDMGSLITVNSATMMNKGFEVMEAHELFQLDYSRIKVLVHPQSLVHGIVELNEGSQVLMASPADMRYPITLAMFYPEIPEGKLHRLDLRGKKLEFSQPDMKKFPLLKLAYDIGREGGALPCALVAANEAAVGAFLKKKILFPDIQKTVVKTMDRIGGRSGLPLPESAEALESIGNASREEAEKIMASS